MSSPSNVFVLTTGRSGSESFARACAHITNFSVAHESCAADIGDARFSYPAGHIEVDNRLAWHLGGLHRRFPDAFYVHLLRDPEAVARSYQRRWQEPRTPLGLLRHQARLAKPWRSLPAVFGNGILLRYSRWRPEDQLEVARFLVETVNDNIIEFLRSKPHLTLSIDQIEEQFPAFWNRIDAEGNLGSAIGEFMLRHNSTQTNRLRQW